MRETHSASAIPSPRLIPIPNPIPSASSASNTKVYSATKCNTMRSGRSHEVMAEADFAERKRLLGTEQIEVKKQKLP